MNKPLQYLKKFDWTLFSAVFLLSCFGLMEIYSIALGREAENLLNFKKQAVFILIGLILFFFFSFLDYNFLQNSIKYIYTAAAGLLILVLTLGKTVRGTTGWFSIAGFGIQPAEFAKIVLILSLAYFFSSRALKIRPLKQLVVSGLIAGIFIGLTFLQPDFGSAVILLFIWIMMLFFSGFDKKYFLAMFFIGILTFAWLWFFNFQDYQKERIFTFLQPSTNSLEEGYNINQALIAIGSGGLIGRGVGFGSQSQLKFLPEAQNDFIFAVIAEELGFLGILIVFFFYGIIFYRCLVASKKISNDFGTFFVLGAMGLIFIEMFINISMNSGLLPVVGISLPFLSYGGSSVISSFILLGIVQNIIIKSKINY
jgi:rod shape determining protein RodA